MVEDKIQILLKDLHKLKEDLKALRKEMKQEEKLDTPEYLDIKRVYNDVKKQKKDAEEIHEQELAGNEDYQKLRELKVKKEEEIAEVNKKLFEAIGTLPPKPWQINLELEEGAVKVQIMPEMRLYLNGKEEKKRAM
ncbi:MAG TPA: hypothetical protein P5229_04085 [Candidatus Gracilibacteria bacterium]|nr:hypothetical protein [Candidatus Gracilibacteria bacterium]HRY91489.1 hypothetical protein [Candidatus Gracilibacteria bacterium]